jgi:hypothetical protein
MIRPPEDLHRAFQADVGTYDATALASALYWDGPLATDTLSGGALE